MRLEHSRPLFSLLLGWFAFLAPSAAMAQAPPPPPPEPKPPKIVFEPRAIKIEDLQPGDKVVLFSVAREITDSVTRVVRRDELLTDDDADGAVVFDLERDVPTKSVWFAVNLTSGKLAVAAPEGTPFEEVALTPRAIRAALDGLDLDSVLLHMVLVRPGAGAWGMRVGDGGASDEDGEQDGTVRAALADLRSIADSPAAPTAFSPKDVLLIVDPERLKYVAVSLQG